MRRTIRHTSFSATDGEQAMDFIVCGMLTEGKARTYAAGKMGSAKSKVRLTSPLVVTSDLYYMCDEVFVQYAEKITKERD